MFVEANEIDDIETILYYVTSTHTMEPATEYRYLVSALKEIYIHIYSIHNVYTIKFGDDDVQ